MVGTDLVLSGGQCWDRAATAPLTAPLTCKEQLTRVWQDVSELVLLPPSPLSSCFPSQPHSSHLGGAGHLTEAGHICVRQPSLPLLKRDLHIES